MRKITINILDNKIHLASYDSENPENAFDGKLSKKELLNILSDPKLRFKSYKKVKTNNNKIMEVIDTPEFVLRISGLKKLKNVQGYNKVKKKIEEAKAISRYKQRASKKQYKANRRKSVKGKILKFGSVIVLLGMIPGLLMGLYKYNHAPVEIDALASAAPRYTVGATLDDSKNPSVYYAEELIEQPIESEKSIIEEQPIIEQTVEIESAPKAKTDFTKLSENMSLTLPFIEHTITMDYENNYRSEKVEDCRRDYLNVLSKYARMYGVDGNFFLAQACQEKGVHSSVPDEGGGIGILQIQHAVWEGQDYQAYNYETNSYDYVHILNLNEDKTGRTDVIEIDLRNLEDQVRLAAMIDSNLLTDYKGNYELTAYAYNWGQGASHKHIRKYCAAFGLDFDKVLNGEYTNEIRDYFINQYGNNYFLKVAQFFPDDEFRLNAKILVDGKVVDVVSHVQNQRVMNNSAQLKNT